MSAYEKRRVFLMVSVLSTFTKILEYVSLEIWCNHCLSSRSFSLFAALLSFLPIVNSSLSSLFSSLEDIPLFSQIATPFIKTKEPYYWDRPHFLIYARSSKPPQS